MKCLPLKLSANPTGWKLFFKRNQDPKFAQFKKTILERDNYTCRYCGFCSDQLQEVVNINGNYRDMRSDNLATCCPVCTPCHFINVSGFGSLGSGKVIYFPSMTQNQTSALCHVLLCAIHNSTPIADKARNLYNQLEQKANIVENSINKGFSNPARIGQSIIDCQIKDKDALSTKLLKNLRLIPTLESYAKHVSLYSISAIEDSYKVIKQIGGG
ncbi:MAG: hypothetical protein CMF46_00605 [Legionellales bacterium]|nr:hypothetical protein [Legionellales bacterium]|tara:strand:+ start:197 stop:838 length:642 start_codon:yes stop_codon:yes gene_type:complete